MFSSGITAVFKHILYWLTFVHIYEDLVDWQLSDMMRFRYINLSVFEISCFYLECKHAYFIIVLLNIYSEDPWEDNIINFGSYILAIQAGFNIAKHYLHFSNI